VDKDALFLRICAKSCKNLVKTFGGPLRKNKNEPINNVKALNITMEGDA